MCVYCSFCGHGVNCLGRACGRAVIIRSRFDPNPCRAGHWNLSCEKKFTFLRFCSRHSEINFANHPHTTRSWQCGCGEIGRRTRFRFWRREAWGFKSLHPHHYYLSQFAETTSTIVDSFYPPLYPPFCWRCTAEINQARAHVRHCALVSSCLPRAWSLATCVFLHKRGFKCALGTWC